LSIWLFTLHMPERDFWRTMTPARLHALFDSYFERLKPRPVPTVGTEPDGEPPGIYSAISQMGGF